MIGNVTKVDKPTHFICLDYIEVNDVPSVMCHIDVHKWNKSTKKEILDDIEKVALEEPLDKYVVWDGKDKKHWKFITMVGFKEVGYTDNYGDREYMYIWSKK